MQQRKKYYRRAKNSAAHPNSLELKKSAVVTLPEPVEDNAPVYSWGCWGCTPK